MTPAEAAATYAAHGWQPIALRSNDKRPLLPGWQTTPLADTLAAMAANRGANIGVAVPPGFMVLDIDTKGEANGFDTLAQWPPLPDTLTATTPSGGQHLWFRLPPAVRTSNRVAIAGGLDVRTAGGFVVVAPSVIGGKPYTWLNWDGITDPQMADAPPWLLQLIQQRPAPAPTAAQVDDPIPDGCRNSTLTSIAGHLRNAGLNAEEIAATLERVNERRCSPPLDDSEVAGIAASVGRYPTPPNPWQVFGQSGELPPGAMAAPMSSGLSAAAITEGELNSAHATPDCVVENLLFADVGVLIAPGGIGKTTLVLSVAPRIVLGRDVFGETIRKPGRVLILTAEDSRQILVARLRACMATMELTEAERRKVMDGVRIADVSGAGFKLTEVAGDVVRPALNVDALIELGREIDPVLIVIDPAVSFGVGESRVNDAEQGLIEAARRLRNALNSCVLYIHHSGKQNGREKALDQYAGRGGSAFADGARMVMVLQPLPPDEFEHATGQRLEPGESGLVLARPKMSYCPPPGEIYIKRQGFRFERVTVTTGRLKVEAHADQLWQLLNDELAAGRRHSKNTIEQTATLKRGETRGALAWLEASGRIEYRDDSGTRRRGPQQYIHPITSPTTFGEVSENLPKNVAVTSPVENPKLPRRAYRELKPGEVIRQGFIPLFPNFAKNARRGFGEVGEVVQTN